MVFTVIAGFLCTAVLITQIGRIHENLTLVDKFQIQEKLNQVHYEQKVLKKVALEMSQFETQSRQSNEDDEENVESGTIRWYFREKQWRWGLNLLPIKTNSSRSLVVEDELDIDYLNTVNLDSIWEKSQHSRKLSDKKRKSSKNSKVNGSTEEEDEEDFQ